MILFFGLLLAPLAASGMERGDPAPDFRLEALDGQEYALSDFKGRIILLKLATTWCPTCKQLSGAIEDLGPYLKEKDVVFLDVFVQDSEKMIRKYLDKHDYAVEHHALLDDGQAYNAYTVYLIPRLLILDQDLKVAFDSAGESLGKRQIKEKVAKLSEEEGQVAN